MLENRLCSFVKLYDFFFFRRNGVYVIFNFPENNLIIYNNAVKRNIENVSEYGSCSVYFANEQVRRLNIFKILKSGFPFTDKSFEFGIKVLYFFAFSNSPHNDTVILRFDTLNEGFKAVSFLGRLNLLRNRDLVVKRHQHKIPSGY